MANNIYIGSRYVPIFDGDWDSSKSYEPLTIVQYSNNSYTSKIPVPAGTLPTNTSYWALTGNYNGQIANIMSLIANIKNTTRTVLYIGDSFMYGPSHLTTPLDAKLNVVTSYNFSYGGTGFVRNTNNRSFPNQIQNAIEDASVDKNAITDVIICGGINDDWATSFDEYVLAINSMITKINTHMPNAKMWIAPMLWGTSNFVQADQSKYDKIYRAACYCGVATLPNAYSILQGLDSDTYMLDGSHPNAAGCELIAGYIADFVNGGVANIQSYAAGNGTNSENDSYTYDIRRLSGIVSLTYFLYIRNHTYAADDKILDIPGGLIQDTGIKIPINHITTAGSFDGKLYLKHDGLYTSDTLASVDVYVNGIIPDGYIY